MASSRGFLDRAVRGSALIASTRSGSTPSARTLRSEPDEQCGVEFITEVTMLATWRSTAQVGRTAFDGLKPQALVDDLGIEAELGVFGWLTQAGRLPVVRLFEQTLGLVPGIVGSTPWLPPQSVLVPRSASHVDAILVKSESRKRQSVSGAV